MDDVLTFYAALPAPLKVISIGLLILFLLAIVKRAVKLAILVTILIILMFVARAVYLSTF